MKKLTTSEKAHLDRLIDFCKRQSIALLPTQDNIKDIEEEIRVWYFRKDKMSRKDLNLLKKINHSKVFFMLKSIEYENSTVFEDMKIELSPGINIFIGEDEILHLFGNHTVPCKLDKTKKHIPTVCFSEKYIIHPSHFDFPYSEEPKETWKKQLLEKIQNILHGKIIEKNKKFLLRLYHGEFDISSLSPGFYKIGLLWVLIKDGTLSNGSLLCWDKPESCISPNKIKDIVGILLELQRQGIQVFITTFSYLIVKEFDLQMEKEDNILFNSLYRAEDFGKIKVASTHIYSNLTPNIIDDAFGSIVDREIQKSMKGLGK